MEQHLRAYLRGKLCLRMSVTSASRYHNEGIPGIHYMTTPMMLLNVTSRGKKLIFHFMRSDGSMVYLISFMGMAGRWQYVDSQHSGVVMHFGVVKEKRHCLLHITTECIYYHDHRHQGTLQMLVTDAEMKHAFKHVGPDLLYDNVSLSQYATVLRGKRIRHWPICKYIMDQKRVAGCGNWIKSEVLYGAGIAPTRALSSLNDDDITRLYYWTLHIIAEGCAKGGLTIGDFYAPDGARGQYLCMAYKKKSCPKGHPITKGVYGGAGDRKTHWCPICQH